MGGKLELIAKILDNLSNLTVSKMIVYCFVIVVLYFSYIFAEPIKDHVEKMLTHSQQVTYFNPSSANVNPEKVLNMQVSIKSYIQRYPDIGMILVYKFVPDQDTFYQGRVLISSIVNDSTHLQPEKYNLDWLPISAFRAESNPILNGRIFTLELEKLNSDYLQTSYEYRDEYLSPINFNALYYDGAKYVVAIPVRTGKVIGYVSVYFTREPISTEEQLEFVNIAKIITVDAGYYISF